MSMYMYYVYVPVSHRCTGRLLFCALCTCSACCPFIHSELDTSSICVLLTVRSFYMYDGCPEILIRKCAVGINTCC